MMHHEASIRFGRGAAAGLVLAAALLSSARAWAATVADFVGMTVEVVVVDAEGGEVRGSGHVASDGTLALDVGGISVVLLLSESGGVVTWSVEASEGVGTEETLSTPWQGAGQLGVLALPSGAVVYLGEPGQAYSALDPTVDLLATPGMIGLVAGLLLWQIFIRSWRRGSVEL